MYGCVCFFPKICFLGPWVGRVWSSKALKLTVSTTLSGRSVGRHSPQQKSFFRKNVHGAKARSPFLFTKSLNSAGPAEATLPSSSSHRLFFYKMEAYPQEMEASCFHFSGTCFHFLKMEAYPEEMEACPSGHASIFRGHASIFR